MLMIHAISLLVAIVHVAAQGAYNPMQYPQSNDPAPSIVYVDVYESCTDTTSATNTITATVTATTCPLCSTHTTVYTTVYQTLCSTGMADATYTVTEYCTGTTPSWSNGPSYVPPGFTVTQTVCTVCNSNGSPTSVMLTVPHIPTASASWWHPPPSGPPPPANTGAGLGPWPPASHGPATGSWKASGSAAENANHGPTTTTQTMCNGKTTMCPKMTSSSSTTTTATVTNSRTMTRSGGVQPYSGNYAATPAANAWGGIVGGAMAAIGAALL